MTGKRKRNAVHIPKAESEFCLKDSSEAEKQIAAAMLTGMIGHRLTLEYMPSAYYDNEDGDGNKLSKGHLYSAYVNDNECKDSEDFGESLHVLLDDRLGDIRLQFVNEL